MRSIHAAAGCTLALLLLPGLGWTQDKPIRAANVSREFHGQYEWTNGGAPYAIGLHIIKIEEKGGTIRFWGTHLYSPGDYAMKVEGTIDAKSRRLTIRESEPSQPGAEIDGSFEGTLSTDGQTIAAVWISNATGSRGNLKLQAKKTK